MIVLSAGFCMATLYSQIRSYMNFDVIPVIHQVEEEQVVFPAVTLCAKWNKNNPIKLNLNHIEMCKFETVKCKINTDIEMFTIERGLYSCLRYNGYSKIPGSDQINGLKKISDIDSDGFVLKLNFKADEFKFYIQDNYLNTYKNSLEYTIENGENYLVYVSKSVDKKLGEPYNHCEINNDVSYRQSNCLEQCANRKTAETYDCSLVYGYYAEENLPECENDIKRLKSDFMIECDKTCPRECESTTWNGDIKPRVSNKNGYTVIKFQLGIKKNTEISQIPKTTFWDLMSSLGGSLGFLGMSFLTFFEILEFVFELIQKLF